MTGPLYLSRARLRARRGEALASIAPLLLPDDVSARYDAQHRIIWLMFRDGPDTSREPQWREGEQGFLWRDDGNGMFLVLSRRQPTDPHRLFELETKTFEPSLTEGDCLRFALRANPVASRKPKPKGSVPAQRERGKRVDVVMDALKPVARTCWSTRTGRAFERDDIVTEATYKWLARQGEKHGFVLRKGGAFSASGYTQVQIQRKKSGGERRPAGFSVVDLAGEIEVTDPAAFLMRLPLGFGSAKAFGCGLMLLRRA